MSRLLPLSMKSHQLAGKKMLRTLFALVRQKTKMPWLSDNT